MTARSPIRKPTGGARAGAGRKALGARARSVTKTVKLTPAEMVAQETTAGDTKWATWAHDTLVAAAPPPASDEE